MVTSISYQLESNKGEKLVKAANPQLSKRGFKGTLVYDAEVDSRQAVELTTDYQVNDIAFIDFTYAFIDASFSISERFTAT